MGLVVCINIPNDTNEIIKFNYLKNTDKEEIKEINVDINKNN